ncbi:MAG: sodium/calcium exchanger rane region [Deltaproteobacteria bacterium]|nr:sodium/calcium exchanger rane region [Deltaproteobacteria bacterium]
MTRYWALIVLAVGVTIPAIALRLGGMHVEQPGLIAALFGCAIVGGAFLLTWGAEVAEIDISQGLALAFLALVAVLPEYAVDLYFAWKAAHHPEYTAYAAANMTGANRLLIGIAWPLIVGLNWIRNRRAQVRLPRARAVELAFLSLATAYSFVIPLKGTITLLDTLVFVGLFVAYVWRIAWAETGEPDLVGPALALAAFRPAIRRTLVGIIFLFSATVILASAEPFAEALIAVGRRTGVDEFLLVQWLAPLASEAPEVVIACILTLKGDAQAGMGAMVSAKVNQWTLLVGTLPLVYSLGLGQAGALNLDSRQVEEVLLTAAQSLFAVAVICNLRLSLFESGTLLALFLLQLLFPNPTVRSGFALVYVALAVAVLVRQRTNFRALLRAGLRSPVRRT